MTQYRYTARDVSGEFVRGDIEANSRSEALSNLYSRGLTVLGVSEGAGIRPVLAKMPNSAARRGRFVRTVSATEKAMFCRQLSISVSSGITLREAIETIGSDQESPSFRAVLQRVLRRLDEGMPFSQAISGEGHVFDQFFVSLMKAAEESGSMTETLVYLAAALEKADRLSRKVKSILAYPIFVGAFFVLISGIMTLFVLPKFSEIFSNFGGRLPLLTRVVLGGNQFLIDHLLMIVVGILALAGAFFLYISSSPGRMQFDGFVLKLPLVGELVRKVCVARFCRNLGGMVRGGVPMTSAIVIASEILGNRAMELTLRRTYDRIVEGNDIASSLDRRAFPRLAIRMVGVGEASGRMPEVLEKVADLYEDQVEGGIMVITALFEPIIIIVFGCLILVLVMAIYLPVFTVAASAK